MKKAKSQLGWTQTLTDVVLDAYSEFIELKIAVRDWVSSKVVPSWCIRQVWKLHALSNKKEYEEACVRLCGRLIQYQIEVKQDPDSDLDTQHLHMKFTKQMYELRFNHSLNGAVWEFDFNPLWKSEYQKHEISTCTFYGPKKKDKVLTGKKKSKKVVKYNAVSEVSGQENTTSATVEEGNKTTDHNSGIINSMQSDIINTPGSDLGASTSSGASGSSGSPSASAASSSGSSSSTRSTVSENSASSLSPRQPRPQQEQSSNNNGSSNSGRRRRSKRSLEIIHPVMTRSRAKQMRLTL